MNDNEWEKLKKELTPEQWAIVTLALARMDEGKAETAEEALAMAEKEKAEALARIDEEHAQIVAKKDEEIEQLKQKSIEQDKRYEPLTIRYIMNNMPELKTNNNCTPSMTTNEEANRQWSAYEQDQKERKGEVAGGSKKKKKRNHEWGKGSDKKTKSDEPPIQKPKCHKPIPISKVDYFGEYLDFDFKTENKHGYAIFSILAQEPCLKHGIKLPLHNERTLQGYLQTLMEDVINAYGIKAETFLEFSLFSHRPDLIVTNWGGFVVLMGEAKIPSHEGSETVFQNESAVGQANSYNLMLRQLGITVPFTFLSTYNGTVVVTLNNVDEECKDRLQNGLNNLKRGIIEPKPEESEAENEMAVEGHQEVSDDIDERKKKPPITPVKEKMARRLKNFDGDSQDETPVASDIRSVGETKNKDRKANVSQVFGPSELHKLLAVLLAASIASLDGTSEPKLVPKEGDDGFKSRELALLAAESFDFVKTDENFKPTYHTAPYFTFCTKYHLFCTVGQGQSGKCILMASTDGKMFVAKLFLFPYSHHWRADDTVAAWEEDFKEKEKEAINEMERWKTKLPKFSNYYTVQKLNETPALTMPYFPPIPMEERKSALDEIKTCLNNIVNDRRDLDNKGKELADDEFYFYEEIPCWGEFGCRYDAKGIVIYPLDLGSLRKMKCEKGDKQQDLSHQEILKIRSAKVEDAMAILKKLMSSEEQQKAKPAFLRAV